ncbi:hypothetical protein PLESTB_000217200 [Pleodorina starrii]|uniref:Uncharacterized protein n=1 Tax=Pleodorina starrii TaxID=330485 RepID=A0A9W6BC26_9CHLO|nr:hypothetical protein PLESTM_001542700 [Pleodorina starrii]GLC49419.1 hypothetical protein PLESTB_000217200 [Pleodorina starrii]
MEEGGAVASYVARLEFFVDAPGLPVEGALGVKMAVVDLYRADVLDLGLLHVDLSNPSKNARWLKYGLPVSHLRGKFCVAPVENRTLTKGTVYFMPYTHFTNRDYR